MIPANKPRRTPKRIRKMSGQIRALKGSSLERFIINAIETEYGVKVDRMLTCEFQFTGIYYKVKRFCLESCDEVNFQ